MSYLNPRHSTLQEITDSENSGNSAYSDLRLDSEDYNKDPGLDSYGEIVPELLSRQDFSDSLSDSESDQIQKGNPNTNVSRMNTRSRRNQQLQQAAHM